MSRYSAQILICITKRERKRQIFLPAIDDFYLWLLWYVIDVMEKVRWLRQLGLKANH